MTLPITQKMLVDWAGPAIFRDGQILFQNRIVQEAAFDPPMLRGTILRAGRTMKTSARLLPNGVVENLCPCRDSRERGIVCSHIIAVGLALIHQARDPLAELRRLEERQRAERLARLSDAAFLPRVPAGDPNGRPASLIVRLGKDWANGWDQGTVPIVLELDLNGTRVSPQVVPRDRPLALTRTDENILFVLEDIAGGTPGDTIRISPSDFLALLTLCTGRILENTEGEIIGEVSSQRMETRIRASWIGETGEMELRVTLADDLAQSAPPPRFLVSGLKGWVFWRNQFHPLERILPLPLHDVYRGPIRIPHPAVPRFLKTEWPVLARLMPAECDVSLEWFRFDPADPTFRLKIRGSPGSLAFALEADYDGHSFVAGCESSHDVFLPDPADPFRFFIRNLPREKKALATLRHYGIRGETGNTLSSIIGERDVLNFLGGRLPALRRLGWKVEMAGKVAPYFEHLPFVHPVVHVRESPDHAWFEIGFEYETDGGPIPMAEIHRAILKGEAFLRKGDRVLLLDSDAIESLNRVFRDCDSHEGQRPGTFRLRQEYIGYVKASLDALDGVDVEASSAWRERAEKHSGRLEVEPVTVPRLRVRLRPYQAEGVNWLRFLESSGFNGILADEMGLGKTLQTLAWLSLPRIRPDLQGRPALVVCPTSLVENWSEEAARFITDMRVLCMTGNERHALWGRLMEYELIITSYALLRRDVEHYRSIPFSVIVLDEAQHIKNRSTQNAITAKQLQAGHRLVLTGTPIENSVSDLWSIMDFLMPGYLGSHESFRRHYEAPLGAGGEEGEEAQIRLRRKLAPFLLRRLKREVARELPPKLERIAFCTPTPLQKQIYRALVETSRQRLESLIAERGFRACAFEVLKTLLQLRQASCHLDLLRLPDLPVEGRSAKLDLFFELLDEALDGGHRILVFSQFVSMLTILRRELDARAIRYCYLDGSTRERQSEVHRFNSDRSIPLFLISLKAGGFGLNLTGADMVIHFDPWWNPAVEQQATDRAYRIGQTRHVYSIKLLTRGTVEEKVLEMQQRKQAVIEATLDVDQVMLQSLTWEEVRSLMSLDE